ncbi:hypothetical protein BW723_06605 [Polaribacter reichenbachii]|uniref:Auto-transporter adhesin head GIN domain-containing protein n=1 Tax=Polaribacter reichenbachii TaxID=996801 RepID=A0A1B8U616_9FLAO|nr:hypothetical protein [Polaribacter reichenbachii]APZ45983.1 hypothetical protein BW723_06605 [Polaribacter reichenbachii]AUC19845.1 hypothetical protein BTO17_14625 [Polaribacter reichenbachii]OBY67300.1 hypothetical protein LPB301_02885 [Polaribacter reichenbachii]
MKYKFVLFFLINSVVLFAQKKVSKQFQTLANEVNIYTAGLDNLVVENSDSDFIEVYLYAESYDDQLIKVDENSKEVNVKFAFEGTQTREVIFRKFITKRLQRANVIVKIPKGKKVFVFGENVDLESKNLKNELAIYIENGIVKLNKIQANTILKLYSGNVYASVNNTNLDLVSKKGKIKIDDIFYKEKYKKDLENSNKKLSTNSIKANIYLSSN